MSYSFDFPIKHLYPNQDAGIPVAVFLTYGDKTEKVSAKLDTGADFCVFTFSLDGCSIHNRFGLDVKKIVETVYVS